MKSLTTFLAIISLAFCTTACSQQRTVSTGSIFGKTIKASKNYVTKKMKIDKFEKISVAGSMDVSYKQKAGSPDLEIYTSDNIIDLLDIQVKGSTLHIGFKKNTKVSYDKLEVRVTSPDLSGVSLAGSGDFIFANGLKTENDLSISVAGSGDINAQAITCNSLKTSVAGSGDIHIKNITATDVEASIAGSGTIVLSGTAQDASYSISGSGDLFAEGLEAQKVNTSIAGSGDIKCFATKFLKVRTSGSGSVGYKGEPQLDIPKKGLYKL